MGFQVGCRVRKALYQLSLCNVAIQILFLIRPHDCANLTTPTVTIGQGTLSGSVSYTDEGTGYYQFISVPYAKPPVGDLRFKSPQPPQPWSGVRNATVASKDHVAAQIDYFTGNYTGSEDCLYLNVYTPKLPNDGSQPGLLPVFFEIHGGAFVRGNGIMKNELGPDYLINNNVVVVTINYRLNVFGFLNLQMPEASGNMGMKDQVAALKWVQNNIDKFGGDKNNVTISGYSSGAAAVEYHMLSPQSNGLFHKAILQSGSTLNHWAMNFEPQVIISDVLQRLGFQGSADNQQAVYNYLMTISPDLLTAATFKAIDASFPDRLFYGFVPTIEKDFGNGDAFITDAPFKLLTQGKFNKVPAIKGFCEKEGYVMYLTKPASVKQLAVDKNFTKHLRYSMNTIEQNWYNMRFAFAYNNSVVDPTDAVNSNIIDFFSDHDFIAGIWISGHIMSFYGANVYLYKFSYDGNINYVKSLVGLHVNGAVHEDDLTYLFKTDISKSANATDITVRDNMTKMWTNFAKTSNPLQPAPVNIDASTWPRLQRCPFQYLDIDSDLTINTYQDNLKMIIYNELYIRYGK